MSSFFKNCFPIACRNNSKAHADTNRSIELATCVVKKQYAEAEAILANLEIRPNKLWRFIASSRLKNLFGTSEMIDKLPDLVKQRLEEHMEPQRENQQKFSAELGSITVALEQANIPVIALKGPVLGKQLYGDPIHRFFGDLDILVKQEDLNASFDVLHSLGCNMSNGRTDLSSHRLKTNHAAEFICPAKHRPRSFKLDLHWCLRNSPTYNINSAQLWSDAKTIDLNGQAIQVLSDEYSLLLLIVSIVDDVSLCKLRLKHLFDLFLSVNQLGENWDWDSFFENRKADNTLSSCVNALSVLEGIVGKESLPERLILELDKHQELIVTRDPVLCRQMLSQVQKSYATWLWNSHIHWSSNNRELLNLYSYHLPHIGSAPKKLWRFTLRSWQTARFFSSFRNLSQLMKA